MKNCLPDYQGGSIVNLMSSISRSFGIKNPYPTLKLLPPRKLQGAKNIVLIVLDGLGYEYLKKKGKDSALAKHLKGKMTSVFPPTTASAITTFATGLAPQQHAFTGWFMLLKELGAVSTILRFAPRGGGLPFINRSIKVKEILNVKGLPERIKCSSYVVIHQKIQNSAFTKAISRKAKRLGYSNMKGFFRQIRKAISSHHQRKYIYAYWPGFDTFSHDYGINSRKTEKHFRQIDQKFREFLKSIEGTNSIIIVTADHGLIDVEEKGIIWLEEHPQLKECLSLPLCGDARTVYCYVHPSKARQFENYVRTAFKGFCYLYKSEELIKKNYFGLFEANPKLQERIGDYTLILKEGYVLRDKLLNEKRDKMVGFHAGLTKEEMLVPLIVVCLHTSYKN